MPLIEELGEALGHGIAESDLHPHCPAERAELFHSLNSGSAELEVMEFLYALVFLFKPATLLETGTGSGFGTLALASAMARNGFGALHTVEIDGGCIRQAQGLLRSSCPQNEARVQFYADQSMRFIERWQGPPFDFVFFDSLIAFRHLEFEALLSRGLLSQAAVCVFHDTSRLRGETMPDYNPEMIAALDAASEGRQWLESNLSRGVRVLKLR